jgi:hypothetical protein
MVEVVKAVPSGVLRVEIDDPADQLLTGPSGEIRGWFAARDIDLPEDYRFRVGTVAVPHREVKREDVEAMLPYHAVGGFVLRYDLSLYLPYIDGTKFVIQLLLPEYRNRSLRFTISETAMAACLASASDL